MKIIVRDSALADFDGIYAWIGKDNPAIAGVIIGRIFDTIDLLSLFPYIGRSGKVRGTYEWPVARLPYLIIYTMEEEFDELVIVAVFHTSRER